MLRNKRRAVLSNYTAAVPPVLAGQSIINIEITSYKPILMVNPGYITPRTLLTTPNLELATPTTQTLTDVAGVNNIPNRFTLISRNNAPHNDIEISVYYDSKYNDLIAIPSFSLYDGIPYIDNTSIDIVGYGITFSGDDKTTVPVPAAGTAVNFLLANIGNYVNMQSKGVYYEKMVTPIYNYSSTSMYPLVYIDLGAPASIFPGFTGIVDINILMYDNMLSTNIKSLGKRNLTNTGNLIVELPL